MMDLLGTLFPRGVKRLSEEAPGWNSILALLQGSVKSAAGITVTPDSAMRQATVNSCIRVLAETVAQLPIHIYRRLPNGGKTIALEHPLNHVMAVAPNRWQTSFEFREMMQGHLALRGNAYSRIVPGPLGSVTELWPLHPDRVKVERLQDMNIRYRVTDQNGAETIFSQDEIFHLRGLTFDGLVGVSPIALGRDAIGLNLAAERYGGKFFQNSAMTRGYLAGPPAMKPQDAKTMQTTLMEAFSGEDNWHKPPVLWGGLKWENIGVNNVDSEFIETRKLGAIEICKLFRMQPHKVMELGHSIKANIEEQSLEFYVDTMMPWLRRWEEAIARDLIVDNDVYYCRFNVDALLRGNAAARQALYQSAINNGWMSPNEIRELEDLPPYSGGDNFFMQGAIVTVDRIINPPEPVALPSPAPPEPAAAVPITEEEEEAEQTSAREYGRLLGEKEFYRDQMSALASDLAKKDREEARLHEESDALRKSLMEAAAETAKEIKALREKLQQSEADEFVSRQAKESLEAACAESRDKLAAAQAALDAAARENAARQGAMLEENGNLLVECAARMLEMEAEGIERVFLKKRGRSSALEAFYEKHSERMAAALAPIVKQRSLGVNCLPAPEFISRHIAESKRLLLEAFTGSQEHVSERIKACLAAWPERAPFIIQEIQIKEPQDAVA